MESTSGSVQDPPGPQGVFFTEDGVSIKQDAPPLVIRHQTQFLARKVDKMPAKRKWACSLCLFRLNPFYMIIRFTFGNTAANG